MFYMLMIARFTLPLIDPAEQMSALARLLGSFTR